MKNKTITDHEVFQLARYAHNTLAPLVDEARQYEPSVTLHIEMSFCNEDSPHHNYNNVGVNSHWKRGGMFHQGICLTTAGEVDDIAKKVRDFITTEQQAAEELAEQERQFKLEADAREEAERAEYDRDMYLQNVAGGN